MPIRPIEIFNRQATGLEQLLSRGTGALQQIVDRSIQIGRDQSNNQARAERDFLTEQRSEIALRQRRAENLQQDIEDKARMDEEKRRFDVKFGRDLFEDERDFKEGQERFDITTALNRDELALRREQEGRLGASAEAREEREAELLPLRRAELEHRVNTAKTASEKADADAALEEHNRTRRRGATEALNAAKGDPEKLRSTFATEIVGSGAFTSTEAETIAKVFNVKQDGAATGSASRLDKAVQEYRYFRDIDGDREGRKRSQQLAFQAITAEIDSATPERLRELNEVVLPEFRDSEEKRKLRSRIEARLEAVGGNTAAPSRSGVLSPASQSPSNYVFDEP